MENFEFKSQTCTSVEQSKRLLELGLKKETADCYYWQECDQYGNPNNRWHLEMLNDDTREHFEYLCNHFGICLQLEDALFIPAWSLHRLLFLIPKEVTIDGFKFPLRSDVIMRLEDADFIYERLIGIIERVIKEGYFNKDYLEERK